MIVPAIAATMFVAGCETQSESTPSETPDTKSASYEQGFNDGCEAGYDASFLSLDEGVEETPRPGVDEMYVQGWREGFYSCRSRPDVLRRRSTRRRR